MQLLPHLYLFFISPQKLEKTVAKIFITSPELWKRHLWAILFSSVCHQILSSSLHPLLQHSICFSLHLRGGHFMLMSWAALAASALFVCSVYRELLFGAVGSDKARLSLSDVPNIPVRKYLAGNQTAHPWEQMHSCLQITVMTVSDQIHRILFCIMTVFVSNFYKYIS